MTQMEFTYLSGLHTQLQKRYLQSKRNNVPCDHFRALIDEMGRYLGQKQTELRERQLNIEGSTNG